MSMNLDKIVGKANELGYNIQFDLLNSTIKTSNGDVKIILNNGQGQPRCFPFKNEIQIFNDNENPVADLVHEKEHFEIFPYDYFSFFCGYLGICSYSIYEVSKISYFNTILAGLVMITPLIFRLDNLYSDTIIYTRKKLGLDKK